MDLDLDIPKFNEVVKRVRSLEGEKEDFLPLRIGFLRNITMDHVITYLKFFCFQDHLKPDVYAGGYNNVMADILDPESPLYRQSPDIIVVCLKKEGLCGDLLDRFIHLSTEGIDREVRRIRDHFDTVLTSIRKYSNAVVLVHNFEIPVYPSFGVLDYQEHHKQANTFRRINRELLDVVHKYKGVYVVDTDILQSTLGYSQLFDQRYWHIGRAPFTLPASKIIAWEYMKFIRALKGKNKKCLVLDCDNTLWGGIIGEDGLEGIKLGKTYPGSAFLEFQNAILNLHNRGVLLVICSKNNERDVHEVLENHPDMVLRREHFVAMRINWNDKVSNLREVADELHIGLDSLVYVDDSEFEINMVRRFLPEIDSILLPADPSQFKDVLNSRGLFDSLTFSDEDQQRSQMYRADVERKRAASSMKDIRIEDYYQYLEMEVIIRTADDFAIPRIAQLTQRTNQFNLTTRRYSESQIRALVGSSDADVRYLRLSDRFGDSGIVGVGILRYEGDSALIDTLLLSCRVIGRGIEDVFLKDCVMVAKRRDCKKVLGLYLPTKKNGQVEAFYRDRGFTCLGEKEGGVQYVFSLKDPLSSPDYFKAIDSDASEIN